MAVKSFFLSISECFLGSRDDRDTSSSQVFRTNESLEDVYDVLSLPSTPTKLHVLERQHNVLYRSQIVSQEKSLDQPHDPDRLVKSIRNNVIGEGHVFQGPFGERRITYADYVASGRSLSFIEDYIRQQVMPLYANTHTEASYTGRTMCQLRESARRTIHGSVGGGPGDIVIALGSGSTAAINRMVDVLGLRASPTGWDYIPEDERAVVFVGPFEHHSNELPWRESNAEVIRIPADKSGHIDQTQLAYQLVLYKDRPLRIGSFSAASNVTGILSDTDAITQLLHQHGALAFWDYAAAAPYVHIDMNPDRDSPLGLRNKDAIFISPHKFIGGPGTPGILVAKSRLFKNSVPCVPGGGTVDFVTPDSHSYLSDIVHREEGGTPAIIEMVRAGLVFQLKDKVGASVIEHREKAMIKTAIKHLRKNPRLQILGSHDAERLSVLSFLVRDSQGQVLHQNFVVALLNDLFGIQARGGCSCAGPYGHFLLNIDPERSRIITDAIADGFEGVKPGWVRVNFNYFISKEAFTFILDAITFIAAHASSFIGQYKFDMSTGAWTHREADTTPILDMESIVYSNSGIVTKAPSPRASESVLPSYLAEARRLAAKQPTSARRMVTWPKEVDNIRWFPV